MGKDVDIVKKDHYELVPTEKLESNVDRLIDLTDALLHSIKKSDIKDIEVEKKFRIIKDNVTTVENAQRVIRLEKGQSTGNVMVLVQAIREARKRIQKKGEEEEVETV